MKQISIPILKEGQIKFMTEKIKKAFKLKSERKKLINEVLKEIDKECEKLNDK